MFEIKMTEEEINTVLAGLGKLPAEISLNTILKVRGQAQKQLEELKCKKEGKAVNSAKETSKN